MPGSDVRLTCRPFTRSRPATRVPVTSTPKCTSNGRWSRPLSEPLLALDHVSQVFRTRQGDVRAIDNVSLAVEEGQVVCLVGESGSGKTTSAKIAAGLRRPTSGSVRFLGHDISRMDRGSFTTYRRAVQYIHQDPYASLNPVHTVLDTLTAPLRHHRLVRNAN